MKVILFFGCVLLASCGARLELGNGRNENNVVVARSEVVRANLESKNERELVVSSLKVREPGAADGGGQWMSGAVTFRGFSEGQLGDFAVIPEGSGEVFMPRNGRYTQVDGFWWRGDRVNWYKIPDHAEAWVVSDGGIQPTVFDGVDKKGGFSVFRKALPGLGMASVLRGGVKEAGFYPGAGSSVIGVGFPFWLWLWVASGNGKNANDESNVLW